MAAGEIEKEAIRLQEADGQTNMKPIEDYRRHPRTNSKAKNISIKKADGNERQGMTETMKRWDDWAAECFRKVAGQLTPKTVHIQEL